ncbi:hypothetical protein HMPREF9296_0621 [Prevotella disiens FB035-09AN]|uniref:Uncharacterized protein n=1 Tax=Prevotella disiens FB035-09AN TaxID=866771 RepID=E1KPR3_9BACT|nr:hypothetical protein HMPREF9296_0621 [Prevotella disiens FB035-09AN]
MAENMKSEQKRMKKAGQMSCLFCCLYSHYSIELYSMRCILCPLSA